MIEGKRSPAFGASAGSRVASSAASSSGYAMPVCDSVLMRVGAPARSSLPGAATVAMTRVLTRLASQLLATSILKARSVAPRSWRATGKLARSRRAALAQPVR